MKTFVLVAISVFSFSEHGFAKDPDIREIQIDGRDYVCRPSNLDVPCPIYELSTVMTFAGNAADQLGCLNEVQGKPETETQDRAIVIKCFNGPRIAKLSDEISRLMVNGACTSRFNAKCSEIQKCHEPDPVFGGFRTLCGNLGEYIDFLQRIRGWPASLFSESDGKLSCNQLF